MVESTKQCNIVTDLGILKVRRQLLRYSKMDWRTAKSFDTV